LGFVFSKAKNATAITLYILIVGWFITLSYVFYGLTGSQKIVDELLLVIPVLVLLYWIVFVTKKELNIAQF
jgi:hypothetical protein